MPCQATVTLLSMALTVAPARASLEVDASALEESGAGLDERLTQRGERVLRDGDVLPGQGADDALITVRIDPLPDAIGYRYSYTVTRGGELVEGTRGAAECRLCNEAELAEQLDGALARVAAQLQPSEEPAPSPSTPPPPQVAPPPPPASGPRWEVSPLGGAGIALTGVGGLALGLGAGLAIAEPVLLEGNAERNSTVSVAGLAVAVAGAAMAATGVAIMLVDRGRSRRRTSAHLQGTTLRF